MALQIGDSIPQFSLPSTAGDTLDTAGISGEKATVVMFWCNHCPYVIPNQQRVIDMQSAYAGKGVRFAAICANNAESHPADSFANMKIRAEEMNYNFPYLHDESQEVARSFGAERTPHIFMFDSAGKLAYTGRIDDNPQDPSAVQSHDLRNALDAVLAGNHPDPEMTGAMGCSIKWK